MKVDNKLEAARLIAESLTWERVSKWEYKHLKIGNGLSLREALAILEMSEKKIRWNGLIYPVAFVLMPFSMVMSILLYQLCARHPISMNVAAGVSLTTVVAWVLFAIWAGSRYKVPADKIEAAHVVIHSFLAHADGLNPLVFGEADLVLRRSVCEPAEARKHLASLALYLKTDQGYFDAAKREPGRNVERMRQVVSSLGFREAQFAAALRSHVDSFEILKVTREELFHDVEEAQRAHAARCGA